MIKFIHKKHINKTAHMKAFVIYYSVSDIVLGILLVTLVSFFIYNYLELSSQAPFQYLQAAQINNVPIAPNIAKLPVHKK